MDNSTTNTSTQPQLSVIVPAYNVAKFLDKCLNSICIQSFRDFEIILVNDGSTDNTGEICKAWADKEPRIRLIEQSNHGLAYVRNLGLQEARADMIMFVDSDDYIEPDAIQILMDLKQRTHAQIALGHYTIEKLDGTPGKQHPQLKDCILSGKEAYHLALYDQKLQAYSWAKIFDKKLFDGIQYPNGEYMEDFIVSHRVFLRAERFAVTTQLVYHYIINPDSILNDVARREDANLKYFEFFYRRYEHARDEKILTPRQFRHFHLKCLRRLMRIVWRSQMPKHRPQTPRELQATLDTIAKILGEEVTVDNLKKLWRRLRRQQIVDTLFRW